MNIHEYQAKELLAKFGVAVPRGGVAYTPAEAVAAARRLGGPVWVVKAQIHAGGRGKAGGVRLVRSEEEVAAAARELLGKNLVTHQTGPAGREVKRVYVEEGCDIARELYLGVLIDRETGRVTLIASTEGGVEIEEVAERSPDKILRVAIDPATGIEPFHARDIAFGLGLEGAQIGTAVKFVTALYRAFTELDASVVEINPLVVTGAGELRGARRQDEVRRQRPLPPPGDRGVARRGRGGPDRGRGRPSTRSTTSSSTAISAAWSTAPASRWRRWTSSSCTAAARRISSMSAAGRRSERVTDRVQAHPLATPTSRASWSTSSAASCAAT